MARIVICEFIDERALPALRAQGTLPTQALSNSRVSTNSR